MLCMRRAVSANTHPEGFYSVDIGMTGITGTTTTPPALDIAALCLSSWPASDLLFSSNFDQSAYAT